MIIDDDENLRTTLHDLLDDEGYDVTEVGSGAEAMLAVANDKFNIILVDFNLTDKTGIEVIKDIRTVDTESQVLMMTAHASLDTALKAIQESVYDFLVKPVDFRYLLSTIKKAEVKMHLEQENKRLLETLKQNNIQLDRLNNMKSKFMAMASHDLSNFLMTLQISFEMLSATLKPDEDQKVKMSFITNSIMQISRLINDLVDWASIEKGKFRLEKNYFEMDKMIDEVIGWQKSRAAQREIDLTKEFDQNIKMVCADRRRIAQVLLNLLENAVRHTGRGGKIKVTLKVNNDDFVYVSVEDTGEGIDVDVLPLLFQSFYQGKEDGKNKGRLGLGLNIAKEIIEAHDGKIWAESEGKGKGVAFKFKIPFGTDLLKQKPA